MGKPNPLNDPLESIGKYGGEKPLAESIAGGEFYQANEPAYEPAVSRRGFLKAAAALTGAAVFGEGLLKEIEAWAQQNGVSVYIEDFTEDYHTNRPVTYNMGKSITKNLKMNLNSRGISIRDQPDGGITVWGHCTETYDLNKGTMVYVNIGYRMNGQPVPGGVTEYYTMDEHLLKMGDITDKIHRDLVRMGGRAGSRGSMHNPQTPGQMPDEIMMEIDGKMRKARKWEGIMDRSIRDGIERNDQETIKRLNKLGFEIINKEVYTVK